MCRVKADRRRGQLVPWKTWGHRIVCIVIWLLHQVGTGGPDGGFLRANVWLPASLICDIEICLLEQKSPS